MKYYPLGSMFRVASFSNFAVLVTTHMDGDKIVLNLIHPNDGSRWGNGFVVDSLTHTTIEQISEGCKVAKDDLIYLGQFPKVNIDE